MKKTFTVIATSIMVVGTLFTSCSTSTEKIENAEDEVAEANRNLINETEAYEQEMEDYRLKTALQIESNERSIAEFNSRIASQKSDAKAAYEQKIFELNNKNTDLKRKMDNFKTDSKENWDAFKIEFGNDMDELGKALKDFTVAN